MEDLSVHLPAADVLLVVPPFAGLDRPSLGIHTVQACARERGFDVRVLYANMLLAQRIGEREYGAVCFASTSNLLGERFFSPAAYGLDPAVYGAGIGDAAPGTPGKKSHVPPMGWQRFAELAAHAAPWIDELAAAIAERGYPMVGCTTTFEQTAASLALLARIKQLCPQTVTLLGGANCEGEMARGLAQLAPQVDVFFSGESEVTFPDFLAAQRHGEPPDGELPAGRIVTGRPCRQLDLLPTPDFDEYYRQLASFLPESELAAAGSIWLPYESSRGCWWGEKSHCTFCGINGQGMVFREKSPDRVVEELRAQLGRHPTPLVCMVDNIMPHTYFKTLLPRLGREVPGAHLFYEQKANLSFDKVRLLKEAGVAVIQPGIEALSTPLLKLMRKGVTAAQNLALLRYARAVDLAVNWNLLYAFPGDRASWYEDTLRLLPLLAHLSPPTGVCHLSLDRFSPYFDRFEELGIRRLWPMAAYRDVLPPDADLPRIAYHFDGDYDSESKQGRELMAELEAAVETWRGRWCAEDAGWPTLEVAELAPDTFLLMDTRGLDGCLEIEFISRDQALAALLGSAAEPPQQDAAWAIERKACVELDGRLVPLATAPPELMGRWEASRGRHEPLAATAGAAGPPPVAGTGDAVPPA